MSLRSLISKMPSRHGATTRAELDSEEEDETNAPVQMETGDVKKIKDLIGTVIFAESARKVINGMSLTLGVLRAGEEAKHTCENPDVCVTFDNIMKRHKASIGLEYRTSIAINLNTVADPQEDIGNFGPSAIMVVGDYVSGRVASSLSQGRINVGPLRQGHALQREA